MTSLPVNINMLVFQGVFLLGILIESLRTIPFIKHWKKVVIIVMIAIISGLIPGKREHAYDLHAHVWIIGISYTFIIFFAYTRELLPKLSELDLILHIVSAWAITSFGLTGSEFNYFLPFINITSIIVFLLIVLPLPNNNIVEAIVYAWNIFLTICILVIQYRWFLSFPFYQEPTMRSIIIMITSGMTGFILIRNLTILLMLIPIPGKHQTFTERLKQLKEYVHLINHKFDDRQLSPIPAIIFTECLMGAIVVNEYYHLFPTPIIVMLLIIIGEYVHGIRGFYLLPINIEKDKRIPGLNS